MLHDLLCGSLSHKNTSILQHKYREQLDNLHHSSHKTFSVTASSTCQYTNLPLGQDPQLSDQCCTVNIQFSVSHILFSFRSQIDVTFNSHTVEDSGLCEIMLCQWLSCSQCFKIAPSSSRIQLSMKNAQIWILRNNAVRNPNLSNTVFIIYHSFIS